MRALAWTCVILVAACGEVNTTNPDAAADAPTIDTATVDTPTIDADTTDARVIDAEIDAVPTDAFMCTPNMFQSCSGNTAIACNATGTGLTMTDCGNPGCNATAGRCNMCIPNNSICANSTTVATCGPDGLPGGTETCALSCNPTPTAHCTYLQPVYLPNICDVPATTPFTAVTDTIDTNLDSNCNGGVVAQTFGAPICVMRYSTITVPATIVMTFVGSRAIALVSDGPLDMRGVIDASANGTTGGPGAARAVTGTSTAAAGAGGAGGFTAGAPGGSNSAAGGGLAGGTIFDPLSVGGIVGGQRAAQPTIGLGVFGGGGGGAVTLISCRGLARVSGTIDVNGGGGRGGQDQTFGTQLNFLGGGGGGAGGYAVIQGLNVTVSGNFFANGGGGGGGAINDMTGNPGADGLRSATVRAAGGAPLAGTNAGGDGAIGTSTPGVGAGGGSPGGGGGANGFFQTYTPAGVNATITPAAVSPRFETNRTTPTR